MANFVAESMRSALVGRMAPKNLTKAQPLSRPPLGVIPINAPATNYRAAVAGAEDYTPISAAVARETHRKLYAPR